MTDTDYMEEVKSFFTNQNNHISLFLAIERIISSIGPATVEIQKSQISFGTQTKFAWLWLPQPGIKKHPENSMILTFSVGRKLKSKRIAESVEPYPGRWTHHVVIQNEGDLNKEVFTFLCEAYMFSLIRSRKLTEDGSYAS